MPYINFKNYWSAWAYASVNGDAVSTSLLRGGPMIKIPGSLTANGGFSTDYRKKLNFSFTINTNEGFDKSSKTFTLETDITYKPINYLFFTLVPPSANHTAICSISPS